MHYSFDENTQWKRLHWTSTMSITQLQFQLSNSCTRTHPNSHIDVVQPWYMRHMTKPPYHSQSCISFVKMRFGDGRHLVKILTIIFYLICRIQCNDILGCGGFIKSHADIDFSRVEIKLWVLIAKSFIAYSDTTTVAAKRKKNFICIIVNGNVNQRWPFTHHAHAHKCIFHMNATSIELA